MRRSHEVDYRGFRGVIDLTATHPKKTRVRARTHLHSQCGWGRSPKPAPKRGIFARMGPSLRQLEQECLSTASRFPSVRIAFSLVI